MTRDSFSEWLNTFCRSWENNDIDAFVEIFTNHVVFWESPFEPWCVGRDELRRHAGTMMAERQKRRQMDAEILAVVDDTGIARWRASYHLDGVLTDNYGIMVTHFSTDARCNEIIEFQCIREGTERSKRSGNLAG